MLIMIRAIPSINKTGSISVCYALWSKEELSIEGVIKICFLCEVSDWKNKWASSIKYYGQVVFCVLEVVFVCVHNDGHDLVTSTHEW